MKLNINKVLALTVASSLAYACSDDILDRKPLDQVSPKVFLRTPEQLASFTLNLYPNIFPGSSGFNAGIATWDDGTDNQAAAEPPTTLFSLEHYKVPAEGSLKMEVIRNLNWFLENIKAKQESGDLSGDPVSINASFGEAYVMRALAYYSKLVKYGDFPIVTQTLPDDETILKKHAKRMPRNELARFILSDLDKAIELLPEEYRNKQRISKPLALLLKSRIALFEGTFEKYHRGSGRVPGDANWPGKDKEWNQGKTFDIDAEIRFFLTEAMNASRALADATSLTPNSHALNPSSTASGWNDYYEMFASDNPSAYPEVLLWKQYNRELGFQHSTTIRLRTGTNTGWTRGLVESFLMKNGLPIYAPSSGYAGDATYTNVRQDRDERLQLFLWHDAHSLNGDATKLWQLPDFFTTNIESRDVTGYRQRKFHSYISGNEYQSKDQTAMVVARSSEAFLNYIEASYELNGNLDATARDYWTKLRTRAGITGTIDATIAATDMSYEANTSRDSYDWAAFSAGRAIDATLYSVRRERRCEFAGEGMRLRDLFRWRSLDQVRNYQIEGVNLWDQLVNDLPKNADGSSQVIADGTSQSIFSQRSLSKYLRPYQKVKANNEMFDGYNFHQSFYLDPFSVVEIQRASPDGTAENSNLYQNPGWGIKANTGPLP